MDFIKMVEDALVYTKDAVWEKWVKWILLIIPFMTPGYCFQIMKGVRPAPEVNNWVETFINGIKLFIIGLIYAIPIFIVLGITALGFIFAILSGKPQAIIAATTGAVLGISLAAILAIIIAIFAIIGEIRFCRTESFSEAFNFSEIMSHIGKIGWISYIVSIIVIIVVYIVISIPIGIISTILGIIPLIGNFLNIIFNLLIMPPLFILGARYFTQVYESISK